MNNSEIAIGKLGLEDWQEYKTIKLRALQTEPGVYHTTCEETEKMTPIWWQQKLTDKNNVIAFAQDGQDVIGLMSLTIGEEDEPEDTAVVHEAYVDKDHRGQGVGRKLLEFLISEAKRNGQIKVLKLWVKDSQLPARRLYESVGFEVTVKYPFFKTTFLRYEVTETDKVTSLGGCGSGYGCNN